MQIVLLLVALLTIAGALGAWRHSPLYSLKTTLRLGAVLLATVAATVGVALGIFSGPLGHSPASQGVLVAVAAVALATGATGALIRISDAHVAQLPRPVRLITIHRHRVQRWIWRTAAYELINAGAALVLPSSWKWLPLSLGGFVLLACGPTLLAFYMRARRLDSGMSAVLADPWAHWQYTPAQWEAWASNQLEWERSKLSRIAWRRDWFKMLKGLSLMALIFAGCSWLMVDGGAGEKLAVAAGGMALVMVMALLVNRANRGACERRHRRLLVAPREAYFGAEGFFWGGEYSPWILSGSYLIEATAPRDPPARLVLVFQTFNGSSAMPVAKRIPIPEGREPDLELLQRKLGECCRKAAIHLA